MLLGILQAGRVPPVLAHHGEYAEMFRALFCQASRDLEVRRYESTRGEHPASPDECDAWVISGSPHGVHDDLDWLAELEAFVRKLLGSERKVLGVCFGHQLIAKVAGGEVERASCGWNIGVITYLNEASPECGPGSLRLIASHQDQVTRMPEGAKLWLSATTCPIAGFSLGTHAITVQAHPEFTPDFASALYVVRRRALGEEPCRRALESLNGTLDSLETAETLIRFIQA